ncbi:hypothetical protein MW887_009478 [Aspergillus wentii]|nr:hypothetical protein MW887_009478 [Aspergillus wentii]
MKYWSALALFTSLPLALSASETPAAKIGQTPQKNAGGWGCIQTSSICEADKDQSTLHEDPKTGDWVCCDKSTSWSSIEFSGDYQSILEPSSCGHHLKDAGLENLLRALLGQCFVHDTITLNAFIEYYITILHQAIDLYEIIIKNGCDKPGPKPDPKPDPEPDTCDSPCQWLPLELNAPRDHLSSTSSGHKQLPKPNTLAPTDKYPFDTWVTTFPDDDLDIYVNNKKAQPDASGTGYLIPGGTPVKDVFYKSSKGADIQFFGACSKDTPCVSDEVKTWTNDAVTEPAPTKDFDVSDYDFDLVFTVQDTSIATEQYTILADGEEVGKTHSRLTLGDDKYNTKHIVNAYVGDYAAGAINGITHEGFWGSFIIPKETKTVTIDMEFFKSAYPTYVFTYRLDKLCDCWGQRA